jgi:hypothetical protein
LELTPLQRKVLLRYRGFRANPPTAFHIFSRTLPLELMMTGLVIFAAIALPATTTAFMGGLWAGTLVYNGAFAMRVVKVIPTLVKFLDWKRVDEALGIKEHHDS